jgi:hypothetical protein
MIPPKTSLIRKKISCSTAQEISPQAIELAFLIWAILQSIDRLALGNKLRDIGRMDGASDQ